MSRQRPSVLMANFLLALGASLGCATHALAQNPSSAARISIADGKESAMIFDRLENSAAPETIAIRWIDTGITFLGDGNLSIPLFEAFLRWRGVPLLFGVTATRQIITSLLENRFTLFGKPPLRTEYFPSLFGGTGIGQITVRMPERVSEINGKDRPLTQAEWSDYGAALETYLYGEISARRAKGTAEIEIRTVQVINPLGYMSRDQQGRIVDFTIAFLKSLYRVRQRLEREQNKVTVTGACGSNGCFAASRAIPLLHAIHMNAVDAMMMFDGRAFEEDVAFLIRALGERVAIINTAGDFPAAREFWMFIAAITGNEKLFRMASGLPPMIASLECSKRLKTVFAGIRVFFAANPKGYFGLAIWVTRHITMMKGESISDVKELLESGQFLKLGRLSGLQLGEFLLGWLEPQRQSNGKVAARGREDQRDPEESEGFSGGCDPQMDWWCVGSTKPLPFFSPCPPWMPNCWLVLGGNGPPCDPELEPCRTPGALGSPPCLPGEDCRKSAGSKLVLQRPLPDFLRYNVWPIFEPVPDLVCAPSPSLGILISE